MTKKSHPARCATLAIATLALGSTPLLAQDAAAPAGAAPPAPTIVIPDVAPPPPPAPTIVIPEELTQPQSQAAPQPQTARTAPRTTTAPQTRSASRPAAAQPAPAPVAEAPVEAAPVAAAPVVAPVAAAPLPEPIAAPELATDESAATDSDNTFAIVLGVLAALALILLGFSALRRKGPKRYAAAVPTIEKPVVRREPVEPLADLPDGTGAPEFPAAPAPQTAFAEQRAPAEATFGASRPAASLSHSGASVALPRELPATFEERDALVKRMVDAPPDRANPFRSYRARLKRARLILQSLGRDFKNADPWIDLSQYPSNWPELARRQSAAA